MQRSIKSPNVNVFIFYKMKLDYEKLREMAELGHPGKDKMVIKNRKGVVLKPLSLKWQSPTSTKSMSTGTVQPSSAHMASHSPLCLHLGSSQGPLVLGNRKRGSR